MKLEAGSKALAALAAIALGAVPALADGDKSLSPAARAAWGFDRTDLTPHPAVRFGVLANGMRYAILRNGIPAGRLAVRLHIDAGSTVEGDRELGAMHLIEHLIFHGSANLPEGSLPFTLAARGLARWSDFRADTGFEDTVYRLDLARADSGARETALMLMREIASNLRFDRKAVDGARAVVHEEIRARDRVEDRITTAQNGFFAPGSAIARGPVAGTGADIRKLSRGALQRLYARHYVPGRATLVIVGDVEAALAEKEIAARFADWRGGSEGASHAAPIIRADTGPRFGLFVDPAAPTRVTIASVAPLGSADAGAPRDTSFLEHLASEMLNRRLAALAAKAGAPFHRADLAIYDRFATARLARIEVEARDRAWRRALHSGASQLAIALDRGFSQSELDIELTASRRALTGPAPTTTPALADALIDAVGRGIVFTAPANPSASEAYLARIRLADVNAAFRAAWAKPNRLIFVSHNRRIQGGEAAIAKAWSDLVPSVGLEPTTY